MITGADVSRVLFAGTTATGVEWLIGERGADLLLRGAGARAGT